MKTLICYYSIFALIFVAMLFEHSLPVVSDLTSLAALVLAVYSLKLTFINKEFMI